MLAQRQMEFSKKLNLIWLCEETGLRLPAGAAFYNEDHGDYRLKVDLLPEEKILFLKMMSSDEKKTLYRVEVGLKKEGRVIGRVEVGHGESKIGESTIVMDIGPFSKRLVLEIE